MSGSWRQQLRHARRIPFPKLAIVAVIAGAALASACSQPSDTQQAQQQQQAADEQTRKEADEKAWADAEKAGTASAFTSYVQKFGSGAHVADARKRAAALDTQGRKEVPTIDIKKTCQVAAGVMVSLMGGTTTDQDINSCLDSEQKARDQIVKDLATYSSADKVQCMRTDVYLPSYVEWLTCLEMERDVRKERRQEETFGQGGPYTLPKVRSAINEGRTVSRGVLEARANDSAQRASKPARAGTRLAAPRRRAARRGSGGPYAPARLTPPSLPLAQQSTGVYIPPPVSNPSAQINQLNQSFQFNRGLGNNPTGRDSFIRYNLTR